MIRAIQIQLVIVFIAVPLISAAQVEILIPEQQISTVLPRVHVVGRSGNPQVSLSLNGNLLPDVAVVDSIFHAMVQLPYGLNKIVVTPLGSGEGQPIAADSTSGASLVPLVEYAVELDVLCGPRISRDYQKMFTAFLFHDSRSHEACLTCHSMTPTPDSTGEDAQWCYQCHPVIQKQFSKHVIGDDKLCTNCHRLFPDLSRQTTGVYTDMNPCFLCHKDKIGEFAQDYIHGPVAGGTCTVCHNPHGSEFEDNLRTPVPVLCLFCHTTIDDMADAVKHEPFADGHCTDCHDPHATGNKWVLVRDSGQLCIDCHEDQVADGKHRHPTGRKPKTQLKRDLALNDQGKMECLTCHHPHGGNAEFLLRTSGGHACLGCHPEHM